MTERRGILKAFAVGVVAATLLVVQTGCATYPATPKLNQYSIDEGYRFDKLKARTDTPKLFVIVSFSGGGTRAAALSYGVLEKLAYTQVAGGVEPHPLLEEIDVLSSVSGGSFTSAYYGLFGDTIFDDFLHTFLYKNIQGLLTKALFNPINWIKLLSPTYGRIEMASEVYDKQVFRGRTFADLTNQETLPFLMINATDVSQGARFTFTQSQFDPMCSNLDGMTVARAVAASSNFPIAFSPLTVNNYAGGCGYQEPGWVDPALEKITSNPPRFHRARRLRSYEDATNRPFIHLLDGGVADNIGLRGPMVAITTNDPTWSLYNKLNNKEIDKIVVITVDAKTDPKQTMDKSASPPGLVEIVSSIATIPMENFSVDTVQELKTFIDRMNNDQIIANELERLTSGKIKPPTKVDLYNIYIGFDRIKSDHRRKYFQHLPTSFKLDRNQVDELRAVAQELLDESEDFQKLVRDLNPPN